MKPLQVRIVAGPGDADVGLERAGDVGDLVGEPLDDAEAQRGRLDMQIDRVPGRRPRRAPVLRLGRNSDIGAVPLTVICSVGVCVQRGVDGRALPDVVDVGDQRLVLVGLEPAVVDLDVPVHRRRLGGAGHLRVRVQLAGEPAVLQQQRLELLEVDVLRVTSRAADGASPFSAIVPSTERDWSALTS